MLNFNRMKLRTRIITGFMIPISIFSISALGILTFALYAKQLNDDLQKATTLFEDALNLESELYQTRVWTTLNVFTRATNQVADRDFLKQYNDEKQDLEEVFLAITQKNTSPELKANIAATRQAMNTKLRIEAELFKLINAGRTRDAVALQFSKEYTGLLQTFDDLADELQEVQLGIIQQLRDQKAQVANIEIITTTVLPLVAIVSGIFISLKISAGISNSVNQAITEIASSTTQIAASIAEQDKVISQQAASVNQTTTTMEELGASSRQSAEQAGASATSAQKAIELSSLGKGSVEKTVAGIDILKDNVSTIAAKIMQLSEQTAQITTISELVADIANQTNILALNAAVEAARAGEQGKGFSVVAQEVRKLADQSKKSAEKIRTLIREIQSSINSTVMVTDEGTKTAAESIRLAQSTTSAFQDILNAIQMISVNTQQIALSAKQQAVGVQQGVSAMNAINLGAREAASSVSQIKSTVQQLSESAQALKEQI